MATFNISKVIPSKHYKISEAAAYLGVTRVTLYQWKKKGYIIFRHNMRNLPYLTGTDIKRIYNAYY